MVTWPSLLCVSVPNLHLFSLLRMLTIGFRVQPKSRLISTPYPSLSHICKDPSLNSIHRSWDIAVPWSFLVSCVIETVGNQTRPKEETPEEWLGNGGRSLTRGPSHLWSLQADGRRQDCTCIRALVCSEHHTALYQSCYSAASPTTRCQASHPPSCSQLSSFLRAAPGEPTRIRVLSKCSWGRVHFFFLFFFCGKYKWSHLRC